ncbi:MAG: serine/threonine-protein kinase, partial [Myxococcota bacterium]
MVEEFAGRYRLLSELGTGGSATVWLVHDRALDRPAALKLISERGGESRRERLRTEARALAALDHPRVVRVYDTGTADDRDFLVMEYLERGSLADRLTAEGPLAPAEAVAVSLQVLDGLEAAHHAGIVHRDVKPGNVLVRADGTVALCDFGIARTADGGDTRTGVALGSIGFMAPEQRVDARRAGPQADLYGVACTLFNLLTGDTPVDLYLAPDSSPRWDAVPAPLRPVLRRATRSEPSLRFESAAEMSAALAAVAPAVASLGPARGSARSPLVGHPPTREEPEPSVRAEQRVRKVEVDDWGWSSRRAPVGRTAVWVGVATTALATVLFSTLGPLRTWLEPA